MSDTTKDNTVALKYVGGLDGCSAAGVLFPKGEVVQVSREVAAKLAGDPDFETTNRAVSKTRVTDKEDK